MQSTHSRRIDPISRSTKPFCQGEAGAIGLSQGSGLGLVFRQFATAEIASGAVVSILDEFLPPDQPFHLYYANRAHTPSKLRAFIEFMQAVNSKAPK